MIIIIIMQSSWKRKHDSRCLRPVDEGKGEGKRALFRALAFCARCSANSCGMRPEQRFWEDPRGVVRIWLQAKMPQITTKQKSTTESCLDLTSPLSGLIPQMLAWRVTGLCLSYDVACLFVLLSLCCCHYCLWRVWVPCAHWGWHGGTSATVRLAYK